MEPYVEDGAPGPAFYKLRGWTEEMPALTAGFSGRAGGVSKGPWASLNTGLHVGDDPEAVVRNRALIAERAGWTLEAWTCGEQVHGDAVYRVRAADRGRGAKDRMTAVADTDALVTDEPGVLLASFYADCVPLMFCDPVRGAVGLAHAGWKGTVLEIAARTVETMIREFGSKPSDLLAAIGPAIGACCYEVDEPVIARAEPLAESLAALGGLKAEAMLRHAGGGRALLNLKEMNRQIMIKAGIMPSRIELSEYCTGCRRDLFFSHRAEGGKTGRMVSLIGMRKR